MSSSPDFDAVLAFFSQFQQAQLAAWTFVLDPENSWLDTVKKKAALHKLVDPSAKEVVDVLNRPRSADEAWFAQHGKRAVAERTVFALQEGEAEGPAVLLYTSAFLDNGGGVTDRFGVAEVDGELKVVGRQVRKEGSWATAGGRKLTVSKGGEARVLSTPDDSSKALLEDLA